MATDTHEIEDEFLLQLGRTLAKWQWIEQACYDLYWHMMKGADPHLISVNWHHITSFDTKLSLLDACAHFKVPEDLKARWKKLNNDLVKASKTRNMVVHSVFGVGVKEGVANAGLSISHMDSTALVRNRVFKNELRPEFTFDHARLVRTMRDFEALAHVVMMFRYSVFDLAHGDEGGDG